MKDDSKPIQPPMSQLQKPASRRIKTFADSIPEDAFKKPANVPKKK